MTEQSHPQVPLNPPYWRGASDLAGDYGDLLFGTYLRSTNIAVKNGTAVAKRRGFVRAFDEEFWGSAAVYTRRNGDNRLALVSDGEGVKILSSLPSSFYSGYGLDHPGFPVDDFDRATNASIATTNKHWEEGKDSLQTGGSGRTSDDLFTVVGAGSPVVGQLKQAASSGTGFAGADWMIAAPTPFYSTRMELDLSSLDLVTAGDQYRMVLFVGLPPAYYDGAGTGASLVRDRFYAIDGFFTAENTSPNYGFDTTWTGMFVDMKFQLQANGQVYRDFQIGEFCTNRDQASLSPRSGAVGWIEERSSTDTVASTEVSWVIEFGRKDQGGGRWQPRLNVWRDTTITALETAGASIPATRHQVIGPTFQVDGPPPVGGTMNGLPKTMNLPLDGKGGFFGMIGKWSYSGGVPTEVLVEEIKVADSFLK